MGADSSAGDDSDGGASSADGTGSGGAAGGGTDSGLAGTLSSVFLGSIPQIIVTVVLSLLLIGGVAFAAGVFGVPSVVDLHNEFGGVNESTTVIDSSIEVNNPNPVGASALGVSGEYAISMNDVRMANGSTGQIAMPPGNSTIELQTYLDNDKIPAWWASHVERGERTDVRINATVESQLLGQSVPIEQSETIETDMLSSFNSTETRPINSSSPLVSDPVLYVNETRAQWGEATVDRTGIVLDFYVYNPKSYAIPLSKLNYTIDMNSVRVGQGANTEEQVLAPKEVTRVRTVTYINNQNLDEWWVTHVERNQVTDLEIDFGAAVEVSGTTLTIPMEKFTHEETIRTDIFGTKNETGDGNDGTDGSDGSDGNSSDGTETTTDGDGTTTTDDGTTTTTADDGTTTTDDGGSTTTDDGPLPLVAGGPGERSGDRVFTLARSWMPMERSTHSPDRVLLG